MGSGGACDGFISGQPRAGTRLGDPRSLHRKRFRCPQCYASRGHEIKMQVAEGDFVVSHIMGRGVQTGELLGIPPTNKEIETEGIVIHRVRDGQIVEYWAVTDVAGVLQQLGVLPGPPG
ncbi:ester cyclase [Streptomyces sp. NBC_00354]